MAKKVERAGSGKRSKPFVVIGVVLILLGVAGLIKGRITYGTRQENVIRVGEVQATVETSRVVVIPPGLCVVVILGGALVGFFGWKKI
ncbi:MAG: hypothetical protein ACRD4K_07595 [Candidatus Acidiferrales bacterium]